MGYAPKIVSTDNLRSSANGTRTLAASAGTATTGTTATTTTWGPTAIAAGCSSAGTRRPRDHNHRQIPTHGTPMRANRGATRRRTARGARGAAAAAAACVLGRVCAEHSPREALGKRVGPQARPGCCVCSRSHANKRGDVLLAVGQRGGDNWSHVCGCVGRDAAVLVQTRTKCYSRYDQHFHMFDIVDVSDDSGDGRGSSTDLLESMEAPSVSVCNKNWIVGLSAPWELWAWKVGSGGDGRLVLSAEKGPRFERGKPAAALSFSPLSDDVVMAFSQRAQPPGFVDCHINGGVRRKLANWNTVDA
ncbi:hypothetical protein Pelo_19026 [Pelomyxa schiedti]|nr:hypothetical protein Pelo_19026 [Pelomyxa schiedti]